MARILVIEDEPILARNICDALELDGHKATTVTTGEEGLRSISESTPDAILLDLRLPQMDGMDVLRSLHAQGSPPPVIIMTAHGSIDTAVDAMKMGASDFLTKPLDMKSLQLVVDRVLNHQRVVDKLDYFRNKERAGSGVAAILGESAAMESVRALIRKLASLPAMRGNFPPNILITGETGTGKDLVARAIHYEGPRGDGPFVHMNCTAVPEELFEAELFGHVKGAFTSAVRSKKGLMEVADGGTIFLDEIGHMKPAHQSKLLIAIEQKVIRPVGGTSERSVDIHVISATNRDLDDAIAKEAFRNDLYHRLRVIPIELPPLRDRIDDIEILGRHFVELFAHRFAMPVKGLTGDALARLREYDWPGNVRELSHTLETAVLMCDDTVLGPQHLQLPERKAKGGVKVGIQGSHSIDIDFEAGKPTLDEIEYQILEAALEHSGHNLSRAARILGITREAIRYRLEKHRAAREHDQ